MNSFIHLPSFISRLSRINLNLSLNLEELLLTDHCTKRWFPNCAPRALQRYLGMTAEHSTFLSRYFRLFLPRLGVLSGVYFGTGVADVGYGPTEPRLGVSCGGQCCPPRTPTHSQFLLPALGLAGPDGKPGQGKDLK